MKSCTYTHKIQIIEELKPTENWQRRIYADWMLEQQEVDADFPMNFCSLIYYISNSLVMLMNEIAAFCVNPHMIHVTPMHAPKVNLLCTLCSGGILGFYFFFENHRNRTYWSESYIIAARQCNMLHIPCKVRRFAWKVQRVHYFTSQWQLIAKVMLFMIFDCLWSFWVASISTNLQCWSR